MTVPSWRFTDPVVTSNRHLARDTNARTRIESFLKTVRETAAAIAVDAGLTDTGKGKQFAQQLAPNYGTARTAQANAKRRVQRAADSIAAKEREWRLPAPTAQQQALGFAIAAMVRENPARLPSVLAQLEQSDTPEGMHAAVAVAGVPGVLWGAPETAAIVAQRVRLHEVRQVAEHARAEVEALEAEAEAAQAESDAWGAIVRSMIAAGDREWLISAGLASKPASQLTPDERAAYIAEHGYAGYRAALLEESVGLSAYAADREGVIAWNPLEDPNATPEEKAMQDSTATPADASAIAA